MSQELNYLTVSVYEPREVLQFLRENLNFFNYQKLAQKQKSHKKQAIIVGNKFGNNYLLKSHLLEPLPGNFNEVIIINTDNCLKTCHELRIAGIKIEQMPHYTANGLEMMISDYNGNRYALIEQRDYSKD